MPRPSKPNSADDVFDVMKQYSEKKRLIFTDSKLRYLAEDCYLYFESRGWAGIKYWPAVAMKWVLNNLERSYKAKPDKQYIKSNYKPKQKGQSVRDKILEQESNDR